MQIRLNGEMHRFEEGSTVETLISRFKLDTRKVAVERNLAIVPRSRYGDTAIAEGDAIEIVRFIGGG